MTNCLITSMRTNIIDASTITERIRISGDIEFNLQKWNDNAANHIFETSWVNVHFAYLPPEIQKLYNDFQNGLVTYILEKAQNGI